MIQRIISFIKEVENQYKKFYEIGKVEINLNKYRCDKIYADGQIDEVFKNALENYIDKLKHLDKELYLLGMKYDDIFIGMRKKSYDSILNKLIKNSSNKIIVLKILNDLLGLRCCIKNVNILEEELKSYCEKVGYKFLKKNKKNDEYEYKALHIYIKGEDNFIFHIEIQIWDENDREKNLSSHKVYKQAYVEAPKHYKESKN